MNVLEEYKRKLRTPEQAVQVIKSGDWIDYTTSLGQPILLDRALAARRDELTDVKIRGNLVFGPLEVAECDPSQEHFIYHSWHCSSYERSLCDRGLCYYIPMVFHLNSDYYKHFLTVNVAMACVTPMDRHGYFNLSTSTGVSGQILRKADIVILEVNENLPKLYGGYDECIHISDVDYVVEGHHDPFPDAPVPKITDVDRKIAENLLPYLVSVIMLRMALTIPEAIGNEVFITYIGLGLSVETPSLGNLINDGRKVMMQAGLRYQLLYPTIILSFVTIAFYLIGNAFSDAADPKNHLQ